MSLQIHGSEDGGNIHQPLEVQSKNKGTFSHTLDVKSSKGEKTFFNKDSATLNVYTKTQAFFGKLFFGPTVEFEYKGEVFYVKKGEWEKLFHIFEGKSPEVSSESISKFVKGVQQVQKKEKTVSFSILRDASHKLVSGMKAVFNALSTSKTKTESEGTEMEVIKTKTESEGIREKVIKANKQKPEALIKKGNQAFKRGNLGEARFFYKKAHGKLLDLIKSPDKASKCLENINEKINENESLKGSADRQERSFEIEELNFMKDELIDKMKADNINEDDDAKIVQDQELFVKGSDRLLKNTGSEEDNKKINRAKQEVMHAFSHFSVEKLKNSKERANEFKLETIKAKLESLLDEKVDSNSTSRSEVIGILRDLNYIDTQMRFYSKGKNLEAKDLDRARKVAQFLDSTSSLGIKA